MTRELMEGELSWADSFVKDLLTEEEKYQDVLRTLSDDVIIDVIKQLDVTSEEFRTGADILGERALGMLYRGSDETSGGTYDIIIPPIVTLTPPPRGTDDELDQAHFDFERELDRLAAEYNAELNGAANKIREDNESFWSGTQSWLGEQFSFIDDMLAPLAELTSAGLAHLFSIPAELFFSFLADILVPKRR